MNERRRPGTGRGATAGQPARRVVFTCLLPAALAAAVSAEPADRGEAAAAAREAQGAGLRAAIDDARFLQAAGRIRESTERLRLGLIAGRDAPPGLVAQAQDLLAILADATVLHDQATGLSQRTTALRQAEAASWAESDALLASRSERLARVRDLRDRNLTDLALARCRLLATDWPGDLEVEAQLDELVGLVHTRRRADYASRDRQLRQEVHERLHRSLLPTVNAGDPSYPADWSRRHRPTSADAQQSDRESAMPAWEEALRDRLAARIDLVIDTLPVGDALAALEAAAGITLVKDPTVVANPATVSLRARAMPAESALGWICSQAGTTWQILDGAAVVGGDRSEAPVTQLYDVASMVAAIADFPGHGIGFALADGTTGGGPLGGAASDDAGGRTAPTADEISDMLRRTVAPATWQQPGSQVEVRGTTLLVTAPPQVQRQVATFLATQAP